MQLTSNQPKKKLSQCLCFKKFLSLNLNSDVNIIPWREVSLVSGRLFWKIAFLPSSSGRQIAWGVDTTLVWLPFFFLTAS